MADVDFSPATKVALAAVPEPVEITKTSHAWATSRGRFWVPTSTANMLPAGVYTVGSSERIGPYVDLVNVVKDDLVILPDMGADVILEEIAQFMTKRDRYNSRGMVHKRGIIMEGPPGSGKTSNSELLVELFTKTFNGICLVGQSPGAIALGLGLIKGREPDRPIMILLEDIDGMIKGGEEEHLLNLLDGKHQFDGVVVVATTNYLDKLPPRLRSRPSRFDLVVTIGLPSAAARRSYLAQKEQGMPAERVEQLVAATEKYTIAHLKELILLLEVYEMPLERALERMKSLLDGGQAMLPEQAKFQTVKETSFNIHGDPTRYDKAPAEYEDM